MNRRQARFTRPRLWAIVLGVGSAVVACSVFLNNLATIHTAVCNRGPEWVTRQMACGAQQVLKLYCTYAAEGDEARPCVTLIVRNPVPGFAVSGAQFKVIEATAPSRISGEPLLPLGREGTYHQAIVPLDLRPGRIFPFDVDKPLQGDGGGIWVLSFCPVLVGNAVQSTVTFSPTFYELPGIPLKVSSEGLRVKLRMRGRPQPTASSESLRLVGSNLERIRFANHTGPATFVEHGCEISKGQQ